MIILSLDDFFEGLATVEVSMTPSSNTSTAVTEGGSTNRASFGTRLHSGTVSIAQLPSADKDALLAKISILEEADYAFRLCPSLTIGEARLTTTIANIATDRRIVSLTNTGAVSGGDWFDVVTSTTRSLHQVVSKDGAGNLTIVPRLPFAAQTGDEVGYGRPEINAVLTRRDAGVLTAVTSPRLSFDWMEFYG